MLPAFIRSAAFRPSKRWMEWNGRYRDDVRTFMAGHPDSVHNLATRIAGSSDLYQDDGRGPLNSVNFVTSHDGFTLYDLVSYNQKYNEANGEQNRDGENHNLSWNSGFEGAPAPRRIEQFRRRRIKSFAALLMISQGMPMICAGDEIGRTQHGNNNTWCQDSEINWMNWRLSEADVALLRFFRKCIELRQRHAVFRRTHFFTNGVETVPPQPPEIIWQSLNPGTEIWSPQSRELAFLLSGSSSKGDAESSFFVMINGRRQTQKTFTIPHPANHQDHPAWARIVDTAADSPNDYIELEAAPTMFPGSTCAVEPMALVILQTREQKQ
jgi:isoamylase